jgi:hypothetical protein
MHFARIHPERDAAQYFPIADAGVKIIYFEHETSD